jgi:hypothetical protein
MFCHYICNPKRNEAHQYLLNKWKERTSEMFNKSCESSSVGRARPCQGRGREFESRLSL